MSELIANFVFNTLLKPLDGYKTIIGYILIGFGVLVETLVGAGAALPYLAQVAAFVGGKYWIAVVAWTGVGLAHKAEKLPQ